MMLGCEPAFRDVCSMRAHAQQLSKPRVREQKMATGGSEPEQTVRRSRRVRTSTVPKVSAYF